VTKSEIQQIFVNCRLKLKLKQLTKKHCFIATDFITCYPLHCIACTGHFNDFLHSPVVCRETTVAQLSANQM